VKADILLSGFVSGLTILLGVIVADWLKRLRDRIDATRRAGSVVLENVLNFMDFLAGHALEGENFTYGIKRSLEERRFMDDFDFFTKELETLAELPRWPQRNATEIRKTANHLFICTLANLYHCRAKRVLLHPENIEELTNLAWDLRDLTRNTLDRKTLRISVPEKREELERRELSREAATES
jgi:hypothetical protein